MPIEMQERTACDIQLNMPNIIQNKDLSLCFEYDSTT